MQRNILPLQNPENAHMSDAARETAAQRQADTRSLSCLGHEDALQFQC
jgi:hypothetical protein